MKTFHLALGWLGVCLAVASALGPTPAMAQNQGGNNVISGLLVNRVGGVFVDPQGVVQNVQEMDARQVAAIREAAEAGIGGEVRTPSQLRKLSLARLEAALAQQYQAGTPLPTEMLYLAGLQRIQYVFVDADAHDVVLAGPAEGWQVNESGDVVGQTNGRPVMLLDDLLVAFQSARSAAQGGITCSIDPTAEGMRRLESFFQQQKSMGPNVQATLEAIEHTLGPQQITLRGVPAGSHFARVLVAADYRMKRLAMHLEPAPIAGMPSFLQLQRGASGNLMPRWWIVPEYEPLLRDAAGTVWELRGAGVRVLTEDDFIAENGVRQGTGRANPVAQQWADNMTKHYADLAERLPIFAQLQNVMDLAIVAALVVKEDLPGKAGGTLDRLMNAQAMPPAVVEVPRTVGTQASFVKRGRNYVVSASGGVEISAWQIAGKVEENDGVAAARASSRPADAARWWWD